MSDEVDLTQARMEREEEIRRKLREQRSIEPPAYHTECNWCGDPTENGARYCDANCRNDHWRYQSAKKRNGERNE